MLKKLFFTVVVLTIAMTSCNQIKENKDVADGAICVETLHKNAADLVGKEVTVTGVVNHVCQKDGRKIRVITGEKWIMGYAGEGIDKFDEEKFLLEEVIVKGILQETRITAEDIAEMEKTHNEKAEAENTEVAEHEHGEGLNAGGAGEDTHVQDGDNIAKLKEKLAKSVNGYISDYSILVSEVKLKDACCETEEEGKKADCDTTKVEEKAEAGCGTAEKEAAGCDTEKDEKKDGDCATKEEEKK